MHIRNKLSLALILISFAILIPGVTLPVFDLAVDVKVNSNIANIDAHVLKESRSIIGTISDLFERKRTLVASLILLFSVVIPVFKGLVLIGGLLIKSVRFQKLSFRLVHSIAKWSMADVFLVAIFLVFLSTDQNADASQESITIFGMKIPLEIRMMMDSNLGPGFYWFLGYCLLSLSTLHLIKQPDEFAHDFKVTQKA